MRFGIQMYGLNDIFLKDKEGFLQKITAAGYRYMEPCLTLDEDPQFLTTAWKAEDLEACQPLLDRYGVKTNSCFVLASNLLSVTDRLISLAKKHEFQQIVVPCPEAATKESYETAAECLNKAGKILKQEGIELLLRNGNVMDNVQPDGLNGYEWLLQQCGDTVGAQPDVSYLLKNGIDPETFLWKNKAQIRSILYRDMKQTENGAAETGTPDVGACFQFARAAEVIQLIAVDGTQENVWEKIVSSAEQLQMLVQYRENCKSILCILDTETGEVTRLHTFDQLMEAPNWMQTNDDYLFYNSKGCIWKYQISTDTVTRVESGHCTNCNNDHVLSPDNTKMAVSHSDPGDTCHIYIFPLEGGEPVQVTDHGPNFLHGWSSDGKDFTYCAFRERENGREVDVYSLPSSGGEEKQLTCNAGFNDGSEFSPDGKHIWFCSTRTGLMQVWRMNRDGSEQTQMTFTERNNWFPHVSPDGKKVIYLSYSKDGLDADEHLPNMDVQLVLMDADGSNSHTILNFFGGQGSINVNSWSWDSRRIAFVLYELEHK